MCLEAEIWMGKLFNGTEILIICFYMAFYILEVFIYERKLSLSTFLR